MTTIKKIKNLEYLDNLQNSKTAVVLFHGYGASMQDLYGLSDYVGGEVDWYFPNGPIAVALGYMMEGRAWFPIDMRELEIAMSSGTHRSFKDKRSDEFDKSQEMALEFLQELRPKYDKLIIGGFSQGAMLASHVFSKADVDGLALFSGTLIDEQSLRAKIDNAKCSTFFQAHGKQDPVLSFGQAKDLYNVLDEKKLKGHFVEFDGGHEIPESALQGFKKYLAEIKQR
ncbi:MAG: dienelactone hydrolase family protein [Bacteriovoracaceae bacterium]|nr:dienelactone hydrolase family protein [Bacteriovoracaceae bacterium]